MSGTDQPTTESRLLHARTQLAGCQRHHYLGGIGYWSKQVAELEALLTLDQNGEERDDDRDSP